MNLFFILAMFTAAYGLECFVAYGCRLGMAIGWRLAWPFWLLALVLVVLGFLVERFIKKEGASAQERG